MGGFGSGNYLKKYLVGVGAEGVILESKVVEAYNRDCAEIEARKMLHPSKGYNYIHVQQVKRKKWDAEELSFIQSHGWKIKKGLIQIPASEWEALCESHPDFYGLSTIARPGKRQMVIRSQRGTELLFEDTHFIIVPQKEGQKCSTNI